MLLKIKLIGSSLRAKKKDKYIQIKDFNVTVSATIQKLGNSLILLRFQIFFNTDAFSRKTKMTYR